MTASRTNSPVSKKAATLVKFRDDPTALYLDYDAPTEIRKPRHPNEFIVSTGAHCVAFMAGLNINLESVIESEEDTYRDSVRTFAAEQAKGLWKPTETFADLIEFEGAEYPDNVIWGTGGRLLATLVPRLDGTGYEITRYSLDRSRPGPIAPARKVVPMPTDVPLPTAAQDGSCYVTICPPKPGLWRLFLVCWQGKAEGVHAGHGLIPEDVVASLVRNLKDDDGPDEVGAGLPESYTIFEGSTLIATVRNLDGKGRTETTWVDLEEPLPPKPTAAAGKPTRAPWRSFKVDQPGGGFASIVEGHGTTLDDAIAEAVGEVHLMIDAELKPEDHVIVEQDRVVCRVLAADVLTEVGWLATCDAEDEAPSQHS